MVSREVTEPTYPSRNASGIDTMPGFSSGNQWKSVPRPNSEALSPVSGSTLPDTTGEKNTSPTEEINPP